MLNNNNYVGFVIGSLFGAFVGAGLALLLAPQSGAETRAQIKDTGIALKDQTTENLADAGQRTQDQLNKLQRKSQQAVKKGKRSMSRSVQEGKDALVETIESI